MQEPLEASDEWKRVSGLADELFGHLSTDEALARISEVNQPGRSSAFVQATFGEFVREMGFENEKAGLFVAAEFALRPDYFLRLGNSGILLEVERGKTITNNMDLLDFWKCHLCRHAHYLFLLVPLALQHNATMSPRNTFVAAARRLQQFFVADNYTNVRGLCLFGY
ncbi:MAG: hypothetical protein ABI895_13325 [Deltaproteobacteria bacterium]